MLKPTALIPNDYFRFMKHKSDVSNFQQNMNAKHSNPYSFGTQIPEFDLHLFAAGKHRHIYRFLGANQWETEGVTGFLFATWAPNAKSVNLIGDFNHWDARCHPMRHRGSSGVWEIFIPNITENQCYKFEIHQRNNANIIEKTDPYGKRFELRPKTAAITCVPSQYKWNDKKWMQQRTQSDWLHEPLSIYEVHLGSWMKTLDNQFLDYPELAHRIVEYVKNTGFTHIELLPITEHPLDASWGYQALGYFAPTSRFGTPDQFRYFVDYCHKNNIGVVLDWVPAHFPKDSHGLGQFDGSALYEHADPRRGEHRDWGTLIYNYGRNEVKNFLISSALYWLEEFHLDGLRVDAVASMLYLDYSRAAHDWIPNQHGGRENLEAIDFIRDLNTVTHSEHPGTIIMAEESTAWPQVSRPVHAGGLGFSMKWNMGWMHDTLSYLQKDPIHRSHHHSQLTFGLLYNFTENFILPLSHDEVVHEKKSLLYKMPGDEWQQFANLRLLYTYMFTYPGKKLLFMGNEFAQGSEWNHEKSLDWHVLDYPLHSGILKLITDLNSLYRKHKELHRGDFDHHGFEWIDCNDATHSTLSYLRRDGEKFLLTLFNLTPVIRNHYRIGVPLAGRYNELLNSDSETYGGSNVGNQGYTIADEIQCMNHPYSIEVKLPPLGALIFCFDGTQ